MSLAGRIKLAARVRLNAAALADVSKRQPIHQLSTHARNGLDDIERRILSLFERNGASDYIGEPVSIVGHSIRAMLAARSAGESAEFQLAALLHDVGHLLGLEVRRKSS